jgi:hypothetical protein
MILSKSALAVVVLCNSSIDSYLHSLILAANFGNMKSLLEGDQSCKVAVESLEFCFSLETSARRALCVQQGCGEQTTSFPAKGPVLCCAPSFVDAAKQLGTFKNELIVHKISTVKTTE